MDIEKKIELVRRKPLEEVVTEEDLRTLFENYERPRHYIGFEISGKVHLGTGLCTALKIRDFLEAGIRPTVWLADYHSYVNGKLGGDLEKIRKVATGYFKHAFISMGLDESKVDYQLASDRYGNEYWKDVLRISRDTTIKRMLRCITIMGRKETEGTSSAAIIYPAMQAADIFMLDIQIAHAGMDQRKVHMLARELSHAYKKDFVAVHGHLLPGLQGVKRMSPDELIEAKMSKSKPSSAIFIHDSPEEISSKIRKAYCPEKVIEGNPVVEYAEYLILRDRGMKIERPEKFGGDLEIADANELKKIYLEGKLHPMDLKNAVAAELSEILKPSREYFGKNRHYLEQLADTDVTR
ncbi:tyrosine--tRNA ligase [Candidatus Micrarchaeota archaeon]|nr:tyrosine--tRNA ligase [Candidatus Micrarchaeota archaeon]